MNISIFPHFPSHGRGPTSVTDFPLTLRFRYGPSSPKRWVCVIDVKKKKKMALRHLSPHHHPASSNTSYSTLLISVTYIPTNWGTTTSPARLQPTRTPACLQSTRNEDPGCTSPRVEAGTLERSRLVPARVAFR